MPAQTALASIMMSLGSLRVLSALERLAARYSAPCATLVAGVATLKSLQLFSGMEEDNPDQSRPVNGGSSVVTVVPGWEAPLRSPF